MVYGEFLTLTYSHLHHYWHFPTMVGFCHGGNMLGNHHHHHHDDDSACIIHFNLRTRLQFAEAAPPFKSPLYMLDFKSPSAPLHMEEHLPAPCTTRPIYLPSSIIIVKVFLTPFKQPLPFLWCWWSRWRRCLIFRLSELCETDDSCKAL